MVFSGPASSAQCTSTPRAPESRSPCPPHLRALPSRLHTSTAERAQEGQYPALPCRGPSRRVPGASPCWPSDITSCFPFRTTVTLPRAWLSLCTASRPSLSRGSPSCEWTPADQLGEDPPYPRLQSHHPRRPVHRHREGSCPGLPHPPQLRTHHGLPEPAELHVVGREQGVPAATDEVWLLGHQPQPILWEGVALAAESRASDGRGEGDCDQENQLPHR